MPACLETNPPMEPVDCGLFYCMDPWVLTVFYFLSLIWLIADGCVGLGQTWLCSFSWAKLNCPGQTATVTDTVKEWPSYEGWPSLLSHNKKPSLPKWSPCPPVGLLQANIVYSRLSRLFRAFPRYSRLFQPMSVYSAQLFFYLLWLCVSEAVH